ncbi:hypothetical protein [Lelliottia amnigena]|uniref:hypothetical protein n=1 Tax=Lelliottia amnigena TaxID=61646 RepID=UPI001EF81E77|nr:hypothetical protein [Lelliottia amnigena]MCG7783395.1 hypothetical protein [Lelliottia amnigena]
MSTKTTKNVSPMASMRRICPDTVLVTQASPALEMPDASYRRPWVEITETRYVDQMETLPLTDWCRGFGGESFKSMDFTGGDVTAIFVRYEGRFFECHDLHTLTHRALIGEVITRFCLDKNLNTTH